MRLIGTVNSESDARRFGDFLLSAAMRNHVEQGASGDWQIWVEHDDHVDQAVAQFHAYQSNPNDPKYAEVETLARRVRREEAALAERRRQKFTDVRTSWAGAAARGTPLAIALLVICVALGVATLLTPPEISNRVLSALVFQPPAAVGALDAAAAASGAPSPVGKGHLATMFTSIAHGEFWRLATPALLHGSILHLLFNMMWLNSLGRAIEMRRGTGFFFSLVLFSALLSNLAEALWTVYGLGNPEGYAIFFGFSGVNYALFGYAWIVGRLRPYEGLVVPQQTVGMLLGWLVLCMTGLLGPVANAAHVGGLAIGCLIAAWPRLVRKMKAR